MGMYSDAFAQGWLTGFRAAFSPPAPAVAKSKSAIGQDPERKPLIADEDMDKDKLAAN